MAGSGYLGLSQDTCVVTYVLFLAFGLSAWLYVNGLYAELPYLVSQLPEGWALPANVSLVIQLANVGPILYMLLSRRQRISPVPVIWGVLGLSVLSTFLLAFLYDSTGRVGGERRSTAIYGLTFVASLASCLSSVVFYPYAGRYRDTYVTALATGEGLSGIVASGITWIQDDSQRLLFGARTYFLTLAAIMALATLAFGLLRSLPRCHRQRRASYSPMMAAAAETVQHGALLDTDPSSSSSTDDDAIPLLGSDAAATAATAPSQPGLMSSSSSWGSVDKRLDEALDCSPLLPPRYRAVVLFALIGVVNFLNNGVAAGVLSYATAPYGKQTYHLTQTLTLSLSPVASFASFFVQLPLRSLVKMTVLTALCMVYILVVALQDPHPALSGALGRALVVLTATLSAMLAAYVKAGSLYWCKVLDGRTAGASTMTNAGVAMQVGSSSGALLVWLAVQYSGWFPS